MELTDLLSADMLLFLYGALHRDVLDAAGSCRYFKYSEYQGAWVVQSIRHLTRGFSWDGDLRVVGSSPRWDSTLSRESGSLPLRLPLPTTISLSDK